MLGFVAEDKLTRTTLKPMDQTFQSKRLVGLVIIHAGDKLFYVMLSNLKALTTPL